MPTNKSENKIRVVKLLGGSDALGYMDPKVGMNTNLGEIRSLQQGGSIIRIARGSGANEQDFYPHDVLITETNATTGFSWPSGDGSYKFGHSGIYPSGIPVGTAGGAYVDARGAQSY